MEEEENRRVRVLEYFLPKYLICLFVLASFLLLYFYTLFFHGLDIARHKNTFIVFLHTCSKTLIKQYVTLALKIQVIDGEEKMNRMM